MKQRKVLLDYQYFDYKKRILHMAFRILGNQEKAEAVMEKAFLILKETESTWTEMGIAQLDCYVYVLTRALAEAKIRGELPTDGRDEFQT